MSTNPGEKSWRKDRCRNPDCNKTFAHFSAYKRRKCDNCKEETREIHKEFLKENKGGSFKKQDRPADKGPRAEPSGKQDKSGSKGQGTQLSQKQAGTQSVSAETVPTMKNPFASGADIMPPPFRSLDQSFLQPGGNALQGDYRQPVRWPGRQPHAANQPVRPLLPKQPGQEIAQETTQQPVQQKYRPSQPQQSTQPGYPEVPQQSGGYSQPPENQTRQEIKREANEENERYKREFEEARKQVLEQEAAWQLAPSFDERSRGAKDLYGKDRDRIERSKQQKPEQQRRHQQSHPRHHSSSYQHETSSTEPPPRVPTPPYTQHTESFDPMATVTTAMESLALTSTAGTAPINPGFGWYRNAGGGFEPSAALLQSTSQYAATSRHGGYLVSDQAPIQPPVQPPAAQQTWSSNEAYLTPSQGAFYSNPNLHLSFEQLAERNLGVEDDYDDDDDEDEDEDEEEEEEEEEEEQAVPTGDGGGGSRGKKRTEKSPTSPYQSKRGRKSGKGPKGSGFWGFGRRR